MNIILGTKIDSLTMDSLEIAKLTNKEHFNVLRDIDTMFEQLKIGKLNFEFTYRDSQNKERRKYNLNKELVFVLISGLIY